MHQVYSYDMVQHFMIWGLRWGPHPGFPGRDIEEILLSHQSLHSRLFSNLERYPSGDGWTEENILSDIWFFLMIHFVWYFGLGWHRWPWIKIGVKKKHEDLDEIEDQAFPKGAVLATLVYSFWCQWKVFENTTANLEERLPPNFC